MERVSDEKTLLALAAREASVNGDKLDLSAWREAIVYLEVASKQGAPTSLDLKIQTSPDGTTWHDFKPAAAFTQVTGATAAEALQITNFGQWIRAVGTMVGGGTGVGWTYGVTVRGKAAIQ